MKVKEHARLQVNISCTHCAAFHITPSPTFCCCMQIVIVVICPGGYYKKTNVYYFSSGSFLMGWQKIKLGSLVCKNIMSGQALVA